MRATACSATLSGEYVGTRTTRIPCLAQASTSTRSAGHVGPECDAKEADLRSMRHKLCLTCVASRLPGEKTGADAGMCHLCSPQLVVNEYPGSGYRGAAGGTGPAIGGRCPTCDYPPPHVSAINVCYRIAVPCPYLPKPAHRRATSLTPPFASTSATWNGNPKTHVSRAIGACKSHAVGMAL